MKFHVGDTVLVIGGICQGYKGKLTKIEERGEQRRLWSYWINEKGIQNPYEGWIEENEEEMVLIGGRKDFIDGKKVKK